MSIQSKIEMYLDETTQVIYQQVEGPIDEDDSKRMYEMVVELKKKLRDPGKVRILAISDNAAKPSPGARRALMENEKRDDFYRMAVVGSNPYMKTALTFFLMVSGSKKIRVFSNREDALTWLVA